MGVYWVFLISNKKGHDTKDYYSYVVNTNTDDFQMVWNSKDGTRYGSIEKWKLAVEREGKELLFAMNGGMYEPGGKPKGLYIDNEKRVVDIDQKESGYGNFYMQPNGVLFVSKDGKAGLCKTADYGVREKIRYATQSGPMLVIDDKLNAKFRLGSDSKHIRNGSLSRNQ